MEENRKDASAFSPEPRPLEREWSLEDFLKYHPVKFGGKTSPDVTDQWLKDMEMVFDAKMCPTENSWPLQCTCLLGKPSIGGSV